MSGIQRWDQTGLSGEMGEDDDGRFVLYADHVAAVEAAEQRIEESVDRAWEATLRSKPTVVRYYADEIGVTATIREQAIQEAIAAVEALADKKAHPWASIGDAIAAIKAVGE